MKTNIVHIHQPTPTQTLLFGIQHVLRNSPYTPFPRAGVIASLRLILAYDPAASWVRSGIAEAFRAGRDRELLEATVGSGFELTHRGHQLYREACERGTFRNSVLLSARFRARLWPQPPAAPVMALAA